MAAHLDLIDELRALERRATPPPWREMGNYIDIDTGHHPSDPEAPDTRIAECRPEDAALIVAVRNALPRLLDALEAVTKPAGDVAEVLRTLAQPAASLGRGQLDVAHDTIIRLTRERDAANAELAALRVLASRYDIESDESLVETFERTIGMFERAWEKEKARAEAAEAEVKRLDEIVADRRESLCQERKARDEAEASSAAMRSALERARLHRVNDAWVACVGCGADTNSSVLPKCKPGCWAHAALRSEAGAALLAERERDRKLMAEAAEMLRDTIATHSVDRLGFQALAKRLEEAAKK